MPRTLAISGWLVVVACWTAPILAGDGITPEGLRACAALHVDTERLACYDREVPRWLETTAAAPTTVAAGPTPEQRFGLPPEKLNEKYAPPKELATPRDITAQVVRSTKQPSGHFLIELDNGQVWWQIDTDVNLYLRAGVTVNIGPGAVGSYWMKSNGRGAHVKRIR